MRQAALCATFCAFLLLACEQAGTVKQLNLNEATSLAWSREVIPDREPFGSSFSDIACDASGNVFVIGKIHFDAAYDLGGGVTITGTTATDLNPILAKYDSSGTALWAKMMIVSWNERLPFEALAVDSAGNVYVAGTVAGGNTYDFGDGVIISHAGSDFAACIAKYDPRGKALWAKQILPGDGASTGSSCYTSIAIGGDGSILAAGYCSGLGEFSLGNGISFRYEYPDSVEHAFVASFDLDGSAAWAVAPASSGLGSRFLAVASGADGKVFAAGCVSGSGSCAFGEDTTLSRLTDARARILIVACSAAGSVLWAGPNVGGESFTQFEDSNFLSLAAGADGSIFAAGSMTGDYSCILDPEHAAQGDSGYENALTVLYDASGAALNWHAGENGRTARSSFQAASAGPDGAIYLSGFVCPPQQPYLPYMLGSIVKCTASGSVRWKELYGAGTDSSVCFTSMAVGSDGSLFAAGTRSNSRTSAIVCKIRDLRP